MCSSIPHSWYDRSQLIHRAYTLLWIVIRRQHQRALTPSALAKVDAACATLRTHLKLYLRWHGPRTMSRNAPDSEALVRVAWSRLLAHCIDKPRSRHADAVLDQ